MKNLTDIFIFIYICLKNIYRERKISFLTILAIFFSSLIIAIYSNYNYMANQGMNIIASSMDFGNFQISTSQFFKHHLLKNNSPTEQVLEFSTLTDLIDKISDIDDVELISPRIYFKGLIKTEKKYQYFDGRAGIPENEMFISPNIVMGNFISSNNEIIIGRELLKKLNCKLNDEVSIISPLFKNKEMKFKITGIYFNPLFEQKNIIIFSINSIWQFLKNDKFDTLIIKTTKYDKNYSTIFKERITEILDNLNRKQKNNPKLIIKSADDLAIYYKGISKMTKTQNTVFNIILWILVIFFIYNTLTIVIFNRIKEIAILRAIGNTKFLIVMQFILEGLIMGITGTLLSYLFTGSIISLINKIGITIPAGIVSVEPMKIYILFDKTTTFKNSIYMVFICFIGAFIPSIKTTRLDIASILRE